jgi:hypothetical protein
MQLGNNRLIGQRALTVNGGNKPVIRVCAWCKKILGTNEEYASEGDITHGICSPCAIKVSAFEPRTVKRILEFVQEPVFVIDSEGVIKTANRSGLEMLGKEMIEIENEFGGDAFECSYAGMEGGCGNTVHCKTCAIRNTVMDTLAAGSGYKNVPAFQSINTSDGTKILRFLISTERVEGYILLRIDEVTDINTAEI